ncbi:tyrosine-type recombinase/integrase [Evansella cellulosilytica]|uniref:Integrase family protein n=1 Tax=Evansella cellulosilytica (strain ATCC 21833 / DSM 2522 / FERM P-1141 / JCM 9156 / N-4) TaxID=649639 RepID=E6TVJ1_EVAC2|nr:site-specific integrase [Evansella cellulosilytica]ADU31008.1 integrase family protein [Evansella cellulosilytica DSM 2522]
MAGNVENRGNNRWRLEVSLGVDQDGKRIKKRKTITAKNKTEAKKRLAEFVTEIEAGEYIDPSKMKFKDFVKEWETKYGMKHLGAKTLETYKSIINNYLIPTFGNKKLDEFKPINIINYLDCLGEDNARKDGKEGGLSSSSIKYHYRVLRNIFSRAKEWIIIKNNPVESVKPPKVTQEKTSVYTKDEVIELLELLKNEPIHQKLMVTAALMAGLRRGEILGLQWDDIDLDAGTISINHSLQYTKEKGYVLGPPKNNSSIRKVSIPMYLVEEFKKYKRTKSKERIQAAELWEGGKYFYVFSSWNGKPFYPTAVGTWWRRFLKRKGFKYIRFHDLRHTAATLLINEGEHAKTISARLGHADIKTTMNIYGHYLREADEKAANKLNSIFGNTNAK